MPYLEGFIPYSQTQIKAYTSSGAWENLTYCDLLARAAVERPDHIAVIDDANRISYKILKEKVDRFALALLQRGIRPHDRLVVQMPNRHEFIVALYGIQRIGAVPVLAIPRHSRQEISTFFETSQAVGWVVPFRDGKIEFGDLIEDIRSEFECLQLVIMPEDDDILPAFALSLEHMIDAVPPEDVDDAYLNQYRPDPNDVAVLIPTGGTTGHPKIVPRTYNNLMVANQCISRHIDAADILLQSTPVGHGMAMQGSVNCSLYRGATLILQKIPRPKEIMETIQREKVTRAAFVPTQLEGIINHPDLDRYDLSSLKRVGTAGAALPHEVAQKAAEYFSKFGCIFSGSGLGASEGLLVGGDTTDSGNLQDSGNHQDSLDQQFKTVGRNITPGSHYKIIDETEKELPTGQEGELVAKGPEVFTGYYMSSSTENRKVFTADGYYKTGDLAKIDARGNITITGRKKDVIMRGGETLVPGKMEELINQHPHVESSAVVSMPDPRLGERACAYIVTRPGKKLGFAELIDFLKSLGAGVLLLPERLEVIDKLPETRLGKVDKNALREDIAIKLKS